MQNLNHSSRRRAAAMVMMAVALTMAAQAQKSKAEPAATTECDRKVFVAPVRPPQSFGHPWGRAGQGLADMLLTALVQRGANVMERARLADAEAEKELAMAGVAGNGAAMGQVDGAEWMVVVTATEFGLSENRNGGNLVGNLLGGALGGSVKNSKARVRLDARLIDVRTSRILAVASAEGENSKSELRFDASRWASWMASVDFSSNEWLESRLGRAARDATDRLANELVRQFGDAERKSPRTAGGGGEAPAAARPSQPTPDLSAMRDLTFMVVIPETILTTPRVPDPAAETEIIRVLRESGLRMVDDRRVRELREDREFAAQLARADASALHALRTQSGADVLIVGEAIAQANDRQTEGTSSTLTRARVEARAIFLETGEIMASGDSHSAGRDLSNTLACKDALRNGGRDLAGKLIAQFASFSSKGGERTVTVTLEIGGWTKLTAARAFLDAVGAMPGVSRAVQNDYRAGVLFATVSASPAAARELAVQLESDPRFVRYGVGIESASTGKIVGKAKA